MARNKSTVYLGYEDEEITEKHHSLLNYSINKIGGTPDWSNSDIQVKNCPICSLSRPLILQIYAPLENSQFHRTLYIFACLNPSCSIQSRSWLCIRTQILDKSFNDIDSSMIGAIGGGGGKPKSNAAVNISWCNGIDDWGDDSYEDNNLLEENGNIINNNNNNNNDNNRISDDDDESNSMENEIINNLGNLNVDDKNANCGGGGAQGGIGAGGGGAIGNLHNIQPVYAEIESDESELVCVDSPLAPERDLVALMKQTSGFPAKLNNFTLRSFFIYVDEEKIDSSVNYLGLSEHVRDLIQEYQTRDDKYKLNAGSPVSGGNGCGDGEQENYEKSLPAHGDIMFHNFMSTIQNNPGQIIRYSRNACPLLIAPLNDVNSKCQNCGGDSICEIQILPSLIPKLKLENNDSAPIEYGNILIFTCLKSCWDTPDKMRIEHVCVQQEI